MKVLLAVRGGEPLDTLSVIEDGEMSLPIVELFPAEIRHLRRRTNRIAELT